MSTVTVRMVLGAVSLSSLVLGVLGWALGVDALRSGDLLVFCLLGIGSAPWQLRRDLRLPERLSLTFLVGWSVLTAVPMLMGRLSAWHPALAFALVAPVVAGLHVVGLVRAWRDARREPAAAGRPQGVLTLAPGLLGMCLCVAAAVQHQHLRPGIWGFLPHVGAAWFVGLALIAASFVLAEPGGPERQYALPVVLVVLVLTLTPAIVYDGARSQAAAKHADLVMQIRTWGAPRSSVLVYNGWDGFFAAIAWICDVIGLRDPMRLATFWPPLLAGFRVAALRHLFGAVLVRPYAAWSAVALAVLADPVGADYFSPQSVGFVVAMIVFGVALHHRGGVSRPALILLGGLLLAVTHQLSPYVTVGVLCVLVVFHQIRPWWLPLLVLAPAAAWVLLHRHDLAGFLSLKELGNLQNFRPPHAVGSGGGIVLSRLPVVGDTVRALLAGVALLAVLAGVSLLREWRRAQTWALACAPAVGLALVAVNPYGQEGIFRALIFGIPWLAVLAARLLAQAAPGMTRIWVSCAAAVLAMLFLVASFGLDASNVVRPDDLAAVRAFVAEADRAPERTPALLVLGVGDVPTSPPTLDATYSVVSRQDLLLPVGLQPSLQHPALVRALTDALLRHTEQDPARAALYALWSPVSQDYGVEYGLQTPEDFPALRDAFLDSGYWRPVFAQGGTYVFKLDPVRYLRLPA